MPKKYAHLVKPLIVQQPPEGLYPEPRVWMEGKDLEGFNAHFSYGFIKEAGTTCHPVQGAVVHPYDEVLIFAGLDNTDISYLGAEVAIELGEEREEHVFSEPTVVVVPKGTPHGPVTVRSLEKPIVHYFVGLDPEYKATVIPEASRPAKATGTKYARLVKRLAWSPETAAAIGSGMGYELSIDEKGIRRMSEEERMKFGPGNADQLVWMFGKDLEGLEVNFTWGFYSRCGKWHRGGEVHIHPEEEILVFVGLDPNDLNYLGAELELGMGKEVERHVFNKPTVAICPKGFPHLPLITRWVDKPYSFFVICLSGEHDSPWVEAETD